VLLVPGFSDPAAMWAPLMGQLDGFTVHAVDRPSFGLSGRAEYATETFRALATDFLAQVLDALGLARVPIVGNSIGSLWSTWLAIDRPERVVALAHIGTPAFILETSAPLPLRLMSVRPLGRALMSVSPPSPKAVDRFTRIVGEDLSGVPELRDLLVAAQRLPGAREATRALLHAAVRVRGARPEIALTEQDLDRVRRPVLLIWGGHDVFGAPETGQRASRLIPDAEFVLVPEGGHVPWVQHPGEVAASLVPFLRSKVQTASEAA
jgi:pimeloyl-ACP methyl ester carboxylesterase